MTATVRLGQGSALQIDSLVHRSAVLLSLEGDVFGKVFNCALIPLNRVDQLIEALKLAKQQAKKSC